MGKQMIPKTGWGTHLVTTGLAILGLVAIVGSGGGGIAFVPSDCPPDLDCNAPPPSTTVAIQPEYVTALVGTSISYSADSSNTSGTTSYQWSRSSNGGVSYVDIAGATSKTYSIAGVNLGDDGALFQVTVRSSNGVAQAQSHLAVSATPGLVFQDGEFQLADWLVEPFGDSNAPAPIHTEEHVTTGGNPGSFRRMVFQLPAQALAGRVFYTSLTASYDPRASGAIYVIDYSEDAISFQPNDTTSTTSAMLLEQNGRKYIANLRSEGRISTQWSAIESRSSLAPKDFNLLTGPACQLGESCPDFSALGLPMRFGYWRISVGVQGDSIAHGIDNWRVTVWRR